MLFFILLPAIIATLLIPLFRKEYSFIVSITGTALSLILSGYHFYAGFGKIIEQSYTWMTVNGYSIVLSTVSNNLTLFMATLVSFISLMVLIFSTFYMKKEPQKRFYAEMSFFIFSMLGLVISNSLLLFFVFWEFIGVSSYLLIGFWYSKEAPSAAGKKALVITRIGDMALLAAIIILFTAVHTFSLSSILNELSVIPPATMAIVSVLLITAAFSKAAQFPFYTWLIDAMEGPTPVSALLHSATMVAAGAYLAVLVLPIIQSAGMTGLVTGFGFLTSLIAAFLALRERHFKKILAYSTMESLAFMFLAIGTANTGGAVFYLFTHAVFKSLLFFVSGVLALSFGTYDIYKIKSRGSRKSWVLIPSLIGFLSLSAIPPFMSFFAHLSITYGFNFYENVGFVVISFLTALFAFRAFFIIFSSNRSRPTLKDPAAYFPVYILAAVSSVGGSFLLFFNNLLPIQYRLDMFSYLSLVAAALGIYMALELFYYKKASRMVAKLYLLSDRIANYRYDNILLYTGNSIVGFGEVVAEFDNVLARSFSRLAASAMYLSSKSRRIQNGDALSYIDAIFIGMVALLLLVVVML